MELPACVVLRRNHSGVCAATLGIDLASVVAAPLGECARFDIYPDGRLSLTHEPGLGLLDTLHKVGVVVVEGCAVFHDGAGGNPLAFGEKGDGYAL